MRRCAWGRGFERRGAGSCGRRRSRAGFALALALLAAAGALRPPGPARAGDLPAGDAALTYQIRHTHTDDPTISPSSATEQDIGVALVQEIPNYGFLRAEAHWFDPSGADSRRGWTEVALTGVRLREAVLAVGGGDAVVDASLTPRRFLAFIDPTFAVEGGAARVDYASGSLTLFGGEAIARAGAFATAIARSDQDVAGLRFRQRLGDRATATALYLHTDGGGGIAAGRVPARNDSGGLGLDVRLVGPLALVGEVRYTAEPEVTGAAGGTTGFSYVAGPMVERPGLRLEAAAFSLDPGYVPVEQAISSSDRRGLLADFSWDIAEPVGVFGSAIRSRDNLAEDPAVPVVETTQFILGGRLLTSVVWPTVALFRVERTHLDALRFASSPIDSTTTSLTGEVSQIIGDWRPLVRARASRLDDDGIDQRSTTLDVTGELWWQVTRRARLWAAAEWNDVEATAGLSESAAYLGRLGAEQRVSAALFVRAEGEVARRDEGGAHSIRTGVNASLQYHHRFFDLFADLRRNWVDADGAGRTRTDDVAYARVVVPLRWGRPTPPPAGRVQNSTGSGTVEGDAFVDLDGNGTRDAGEAGLGGLRVILDGRTDEAEETDRNGHYRFGRVAVGAHSVRLEVRRIPADFDLVSPQFVEIPVAIRQTQTVNFLVQPLGRIGGQVRVEALGPDGTPRPVADQKAISLLLKRGEDLVQTFSDADGRFEFDNLRAGDYELMIDPLALPPGAVVEPPAQPVSLGIGQTVTNLAFRLREPSRPEIRSGPPAPPRPSPGGVSPAPRAAPAERPATGTPHRPGASAPLPGAARASPGSQGRPTSSAPAAAPSSRECVGDAPQPGMTGAFRFDTNSSALRDDRSGPRDPFTTWARWLRADPRRSLFVRGHTDRQGEDPYNFGLSARRALAVYLRLVAAGAPADRLALVAEGPDFPCTTSDDPAAWSANRRAVIFADPAN